MNRILLLSLLTTSILQSMESPNKIAIKPNQEEKFSDADKALHDFAKQPLKSYGSRYSNRTETLGELCEMRDRKARAEAETSIPAFLKAGANINCIDPVTKKTPLDLTIEANNAITMEVLLYHGADPNIRDELGITPLMDVVLSVPNNQSDPRIKILIEHGARIDRLKTAQNVEQCFKSLGSLQNKKVKQI